MEYKKYKHYGMCKNPVYKVWQAIIQRCYNTHDQRYYTYGGRGITVCNSWKSHFINFYNDMGDKPFKDAQIDRVDNNKGYYKENCRWVTLTENNRNRTTTILNMEKANETRSKYKTGNYTNKQLGKLFHVNPSVISRIVNFKAWKIIH